MKEVESVVEHKYKMLHYRMAKIGNHKTAATLQSLLTAALKSMPYVKDRYQLVAAEDTSQHDEDLDQVKIFINHTSESFGILFGEVVRYSDGAYKSMVKVDDGAKHLTIEQVAPPVAEDGKRREFLDSIMYFAVFENHVVIIQSSYLLIRDLEKHINWLLHSSSVLEDAGFMLTKEIPKEQREKIEKANTKTLRVGSQIIEKVNDKPIKEMENEPEYVDMLQTKKVNFKPSGRGLSFIKDMIPSEVRDRFNITDEEILADALEGSDLQVSVEVTYKRKAKKKSQNIINSLSCALRHMNDDDIEVEIDYDKVGQLKGNKLSINKKLNLIYRDGVLDILDLHLKIREWLKDQINLESIEAA
ncbi:hypothetical protein GCM10027342_17220 [Photobacterium alginatilyticum]|nr:hypothetical protein [Photobacterium alginatilyticum]